jgi:putative redox protein
MDIEVRFPGGKRVDAVFGSFTLATDQPIDGGGDGSAPAPYDLFLASIATCAGIYALGFCQARGLSTDGLAITQRSELDPATHLVSRVSLTVRLPDGFPVKYRTAILKAIEGCKVKKTLASPPRLDVALTDVEVPCAAE